jgi:hypothetical protein
MKPLRFRIWTKRVATPSRDDLNPKHRALVHRFYETDHLQGDSTWPEEALHLKWRAAISLVSSATDRGVRLRKRAIDRVSSRSALARPCSAARPECGA